MFNEIQQARLVHLLSLQEKGDVWIGYWNSDSWGRPCNGGSQESSVYPGQIQDLSQNGSNFEICQPGCFHATEAPHKWKGNRVWMVALYAPFQTREDKRASQKREIIGEILPEEAIFDAGLACRLGIKNLSGMDLSGANLSDANLSGANLSCANLSRANLYGAYLYGANLYGANLSCANLSGADLSCANLYGADLYGANLSGANLSCANLSCANLYGANLYGARRYADDFIPAGWKVENQILVAL